MSRLSRLRTWLACRTERQTLAGLFAFALVVRIIYLAQIKDSLFYDVLLGDGHTYDAWAQQIGHDFWGKQAFFQAPLYPYFLAGIYAVVGRDLTLLRLVQALLGASACVLLAVAARGLFSRRVGFGSGLVLAVYGPALFFDGIVQKASLDLLLTTALLFWLARLEALERRRTALFVGITLGCLALNRESALVWAPCLAVWFVWRRPRTELRDPLRRQLLPFALGIALVLAPVTLRNYAVSGQLFITTSQFGQNLYIGNNADADGTYKSLRFGHGGAEFERTDAIELAEAARGRPLSSAEVSRYWSGRAWQFMAQEPGAWLELSLKKWFLVWNARELSDSDEPLVYADESWLLRNLDRVFCFATLFPLALAGAVSSRKRRGAVSSPERRGAVLFQLLGLSLAASTALFFVVGRYRYPLVPLLLPFAVSALFEASDAWRAGDRRQMLRLAAAVTLGAVVVSLDLAPHEHPRATAYYDLAVSLEHLDQPNDARASYRRALAADPDFVEAHVNLGSLLARTGDLDGGAEHERAALRLRPDDALAHATLGNVYFERGQFPEAEAGYRRALELDKTQQQALDGLAALHDELARQQPLPSR